MKNWFKILIFLMFTGVAFSSCTKEDFECMHDEEEQVDGMDLRSGEDDGSIDDGDASDGDADDDGNGGITDDDDEDDDDELEDEVKQ